MHQNNIATETFINFTNHPHDRWDIGQINAAHEYGQIVDLPFPDVSPRMTGDEVRELASEYINKIIELRPAAVLCQGEFNLCYYVISGLKQHGIIVVAACSERMVEETDDSKVIKFRFEQFREY